MSESLQHFQHWDEQLLIALNGWGTPTFDGFFLLISEVPIWIPLYAFIAFLLIKKKGIAVGLFSISLLVLSVILTDQGSVHLFKNVFERLRPCHEPHLIEIIRVVKEGCGGKFGFISSHAANTFGFAWLAGTLLHNSFPRLRTGLLFWAALVSYSRVYLGVHYPFDVAVGAIFGLAVGTLLVKIAVNRGWANR